MAKPLAVLLRILFLLALVSGTKGDDELNKCAHKGHNKGSNDGKGDLKPSQCAGECSRRCSRAHHKKPCLFFCNKCCAKCLCVPPGYHGNREVCPCYNNRKTREGGPKCP